MFHSPLAGGPLDKNPTLLIWGFSLICCKITFAPGKSAATRRLFAVKIVFVIDLFSEWKEFNSKESNDLSQN